MENVHARRTASAQIVGAPAAAEKSANAAVSTFFNVLPFLFPLIEIETLCMYWTESNKNNELYLKLVNLYVCGQAFFCFVAKPIHLNVVCNACIVIYSYL